MIFRMRGKRIDPNECRVVFDSNDTNSPQPDPSLVFTLERIHDAHLDDKMRSFKLLGVYLDEYLNLNKHTAHITAKLSRALFILRRVKHLVSSNSLKKLYYSLFHSHLLYCTNIISCTSQTNINKILVLQKKAIRIITNSHYTAHTNTLFLESGILPFDKLIAQNKLHFMHSIAQDYAPKAFNQTWPTNVNRDTGYVLRNQDHFALPLVRIEQFRKFPLYSLLNEWNNLNKEIRLQHNRTTFKIALWNYFLETLSPNQST